MTHATILKIYIHNLIGKKMKIKFMLLASVFLSTSTFMHALELKNKQNLKKTPPEILNQDSIWGFNSENRELIDIYTSDGDKITVVDVDGLAYLGDMILGSVDDLQTYGLKIYKEEDDNDLKRDWIGTQAHTVYPSTGKLWRNGVVPYVFDSSLGPYAKQAVISAIQQWNTKTNLKFVPRTNEYDYISVSGGRSCSSWVGRVGGKQKVTLSELCGLHAALHELGHAVGFFHEHTRPDRDSYVQINYQNIINGMEYNFQQKSISDSTGRGNYDYYSIMHYPANAFTKNGYNTITPLVSGVDTSYMGFGNYLSENDINAANTLYSNYIPPTNVETYRGQLSGNGDSDIQINGNYFEFEGGNLRATLKGPSSANFNLYLYKWNSLTGSRALTSSSTNTSSNETIYVNVDQGSYYFLVYSLSGYGRYELDIEK